MIDPLIALVGGIVFLGLIVLLFWPQFGLFWRYRKRRELTEKVLIEDALKYIFKCERNHKTVSLESLAGALSISPGHASQILELTQERGLVVMADNDFQLTDTGRKTATQIVRAHRLWERYLADATGYKERDWHTQADRREHMLTEADLDRLSASLGFPSHDPHGDPIPTARGELVPHGGIPLTELAPGTQARIVHIEDEPDVIYAQILAEELHPNMILEIDELTANRIRFWTDDQEHVLAPIVAANISVLPLVDEVIDELKEGVPLDSLKPGQRGEVTGISALSRGVERRRLFDLGVIPGTEISVEMVNPGGDPTAYKIRGSVIALRNSQARQIQVIPLAEDNQ
jgi:DtxR family Mn-dependent transcriptional regulator